MADDIVESQLDQTLSQAKDHALSYFHFDNTDGSGFFFFSHHLKKI